MPPFRTQWGHVWRWCRDREGAGPRYRPHLRVAPNTELIGVEFVDGADGPAPVGVPLYATVRLCSEPQVPHNEVEAGAEIELLEGTVVVARGRVISR